VVDLYVEVGYSGNVMADENTEVTITDTDRLGWILEKVASTGKAHRLLELLGMVDDALDGDGDETLLDLFRKHIDYEISQR